MAIDNPNSGNRIFGMPSADIRKVVKESPQTNPIPSNQILSRIFYETFQKGGIPNSGTSLRSLSAPVSKPQATHIPLPTARVELVDGQGVSPEQKAFLAYVSSEELQEICACFDHERQTEFVACIKSGNWSDLIEAYGPNIPMHTILKAAYCQQKITLDELATAYIFLAPKAAGQKYRLLKFEDIQEQHNTATYRKKKRWDNIEEIPKNQRFFIVVDMQNNINVSHSELELARAFFDTDRNDNHVAGGICLDSDSGRDTGGQFAMGSASLIRDDNQAKGHPPTFIRGLTPSRTGMYNNLLRNFSDFALMEPKEQGVLLHGRPARGILPYLHDGFHLDTRARCGLLERKDLLEKGVLIEKYLETLPPYTLNAVDRTRTYAKLAPSATFKDKVRFCLDEASGIIVDGESIPYKNAINQDDLNLVAWAIRNQIERMRKSISQEEHEIKMLVSELNKFAQTMNAQFVFKGFYLDLVKVS